LDFSSFLVLAMPGSHPAWLSFGSFGITDMGRRSFPPASQRGLYISYTLESRTSLSRQARNGGSFHRWRSFAGMPNKALHPQLPLAFPIRCFWFHS